MVFINEWMPNPVGADAAHEFIELYNGGGAPARLDGWTIATEKGKSFLLARETIPPRGYLVLAHATTKLSLRNADAGLVLLAPVGAVADRATFAGNAPEGKSFSRVNYVAGPAAHFAWAAPTPGAPNKIPAIAVSLSHHAYGRTLGRQFTAADFFAIMVGTAVLVAGIIYYIAKHHEDLSKLLSSRDERIWKGVRKAGEGAGQPSLR